MADPVARLSLRPPPRMQLFDLLGQALRSIVTQRLKAVFMATGVAIGVGFLVTIVGVVQGLGRFVEDDILGRLVVPNTLVVRAELPRNRRPPSAQEQRAYARRVPMTRTEVQQMAASLPRGTRWYTENFTVSSVRASEGTTRKSAWVYAVDGDAVGVKGLRIRRGRAVTAFEIGRGAQVALIGPDLAEQLFPGRDPVGRDVRLGDTRYAIIGETEPQGAVFGLSLDKFLLVPQRSPAGRLTGKADQIQGLIIQGRTAQELPLIEDEIRSTFRQIRRVKVTDPDPFDIERNDAALETFGRIQQTLTYAAIGLPAIALVVGGVIILNIMLVVVLERTREVGVRRALGATRAAIVQQFLIESGLVGLLGGVVGWVGAVGVLVVVQQLSPLTQAAAPWWAAPLGLIVSGCTGVLAGVVPAWRAARLDPVQALRQE